MATDQSTATPEFDAAVDAVAAPKATAKKAAKPKSKATKPKAKAGAAAKKTTKPKAKAGSAAKATKTEAPKTAKKATATKASTSTNPAASAASAAATAVAKGRSAAAATVPAALAAAPTFITTMIDDINAFDLKANLPALEWPTVEIPDFGKAVADVSALSVKAGDLVSELIADVTKFGNDAVSSVSHSVTLVREAVGV